MAVILGVLVLCLVICRLFTASKSKIKLSNHLRIEYDNHVTMANISVKKSRLNSVSIGTPGSTELIHEQHKEKLEHIKTSTSCRTLAVLDTRSVGDGMTMDMDVDMIMRDVTRGNFDRDSVKIDVMDTFRKAQTNEYGEGELDLQDIRENN